MNQFPSAEQLSSWAGVAPSNHESADKKSTKIVKGNPHAKVALCEGLGQSLAPEPLNYPQSSGKLRRGAVRKKHALPSHEKF